MSVLTRLYRETDVELRPRETYFFKVLCLYPTVIHVSGREFIWYNCLTSCFLMHANLTSHPACFISVIYFLLLYSITIMINVSQGKKRTDMVICS